MRINWTCTGMGIRQFWGFMRWASQDEQNKPEPSVSNKLNASRISSISSLLRPGRSYVRVVLFGDLLLCKTHILVKLTLNWAHHSKELKISSCKHDTQILHQLTMKTSLNANWSQMTDHTVWKWPFEAIRKAKLNYFIYARTATQIDRGIAHKFSEPKL